MVRDSVEIDAWRCREFSHFSDLTIERVKIGPPGEGELQIRVKSFAPGFPDKLMIEGGYQLKPEVPFIPCSEFSGDVIAVGTGVDSSLVGSSVMGSKRFGAAAELLNARTADCMPLPDSFDYLQGASFLAAYKTAWVGLIVRGTIRQGESVLITGAAGGVGLAAVDLALLKGARVFALAGGSCKCSFLRERGVHVVLDHHVEDFRKQIKEITKGRGVDLVYDAVGGDIFHETLRCLAPLGRMLLIGFTSGNIPRLSVNYALIKQLSIIGVRAGEYGRLNPKGGDAVKKDLSKLAASKKVSPFVHRSYRFEDLREAFSEIEQRTVIGRVVVEV